MPRGGKRPSSGPKKGAKYAPTLSKEQAREALRLIVLREMDALVASQIANAKGISYLVIRQKSSGKFLRVGEDAAAKLNTDEELIEVWEKDPSVQAFTDLMNRALDKPAEQIQEIKLSGEVNIVGRLQAARKRLADAKSPAGGK